MSAADELVLSGQVQPGDHVTVDVVEGDLHFEVESGARAEAEEVGAQV
jgi:hypothetical protein